MKNLGKIFLVLTLFVFSALPTIAQTEIFAIGTESLEIVKPLEDSPTVETNILPFFDSILYSIDPTSGQLTEIGVIDGYTRCTGLDIHPMTGEFFAVCVISETNGDPRVVTNNGIFTNYLLKLDPDTAQPTEVGLLELSRGDFVSDISFRADGTLFAHLNAQGNGAGAEAATSTVGANSLAIINTNNANVTILGETGVDDDFSAIGFTDNDVLIQCTDNEDTPGEANILSQITGEATFLEDLIYPPDFEVFNTITTKDFDNFLDQYFGILFRESNQNPELKTNGWILGNFFVTINSDNGEIEIISQLSSLDVQFGALAVLAEPRLLAEVPTLSEYGLIATVVMLLSASVLVLRRRQIKTEI